MKQCVRALYNKSPVKPLVPAGKVDESRHEEEVVIVK
jgi:hypothetical protein